MFRLFVLAAALAAVPAFAQGPPAGATPAPVTVGFDSGFFIQGSGGDYRLAVGVTVQTDGRFSVNDPLPITNTFVVRKARPTFSGRVARYFEFKLMPDFGNGTSLVQDAFVDTRFSASNAFRLRVGKDKTPVGYELLIGDANLLFPERSLASSLVPNRDVGIQAVGDLAGGRLLYSGGVFNGLPDGASSTADVDTNSGKDVAGRITLQPWRSTAAATTVLNGLGFHVGASVGDQAGALPGFRTSVGQTYFSYAAGVTASGRRTRVTPAVFYFYKPVGAFAEYVVSSQEVGAAGVIRKVDNHAMDVTIAWTLTGEPATAGTTRPKAPFDPTAGHWGAAQVVARFSRLEVDGDAFRNGLTAAAANRRADQWTVGFNWFPTAFTKWYVNYERTTFDQNAAGSRPTEHVIVFRSQLAF
jgi:phosphate-selective porin OprO/OprP